MKRPEPINKISLPRPSDTIDFFLTIKKLSNHLWETIDNNNGIYGFQIQQGSKWKEGLTESELQEFEKEIGFKFPDSLRNFYKTMNGLDKLGINVHGSSGSQFTYRPVFYSYPDDLKIIREYIDWIFEANQTDDVKLQSIGASRIFPIFLHRCMLVDHPTTPILSMYGNDIIYWSDSLSKLLVTEIFDQQIENPDDFVSTDNSDKIIFWLDWLVEEKK